jgi:hypothetical protein
MLNPHYSRPHMPTPTRDAFLRTFDSNGQSSASGFKSTRAVGQRARGAERGR